MISPRRHSFTKQVASALLAFLVLYVVVVPKIPNSSCHCHESKTAPQKKGECPFGQLRLLGGLVVVPEQILEIRPDLVRVAESAYSIAGTISFSSHHSEVRARAPPATL